MEGERASDGGGGGGGGGRGRGQGQGGAVEVGGIQQQQQRGGCLVRCGGGEGVRGARRNKRSLPITSERENLRWEKCPFANGQFTWRKSVLYPLGRH